MMQLKNVARANTPREHLDSEAVRLPMPKPRRRPVCGVLALRQVLRAQLVPEV